MKCIMQKKRAGILACLLLVSMNCWARSPVDAALDRDKQFLDSLENMADGVESGQLTGEWFFHELDRLHVKFAPDFVEVDLDTVTPQQKKRSRSLKNRKTELEIRLYQLGFSPNPETGRYSIAYKILNLDADSSMDILLDQFEAFLNTVASAMDLLSYRLISEEEVVVLFNQMAENMERSYQDMAYADVTEKQLQRFQQLEQRVNQLEQQFNW